MNVLLADSGSTKTEWCYVHQGNRYSEFTNGLNPYYQSQSSIIALLEEKILPFVKEGLDAIYFYGAGCSLHEKQEIVEAAFNSVFTNCHIVVRDDMLGAARAICQHSPGVACILGTGCNSGVYDGKELKDSIPSLGFVLGDEGSGGMIGKMLLQAYFYREMPEEIAKEMEQRFTMDRKFVLDNVYNRPQSNKYVAAFACITGEFNQHPFIQDLLTKAFNEFITRHLLKYPESKQFGVGFIGSLVYHNRDLMDQCLRNYGLTSIQYLKHPMNHLVRYHTENNYA